MSQGTSVFINKCTYIYNAPSLYLRRCPQRLTSSFVEMGSTTLRSLAAPFWTAPAIKTPRTRIPDVYCPSRTPQPKTPSSRRPSWSPQTIIHCVWLAGRAVTFAADWRNVYALLSAKRKHLKTRANRRLTVNNSTIRTQRRRNR